MISTAASSKFRLPFLWLFAALVCSVVIVIPFLPSLGPASRAYIFELQFASDTPGEAQLFYDIGRGFSESDSVRAAVVPGASSSPLQFRLPTGKYRQLRLDPIDRPARIRFQDARIRLASGDVVHRFAPADFIAQTQIAELQIADDSVQMVTASDGHDPTLQVVLARPLDLTEQRPIVRDLLKRALPTFGALTGILLLLRHLAQRWQERGRPGFHRFTHYFVAHPSHAVAITAVVAVTLSCYPVVFLGKSFVSPNFSDGTHLLYGEFPTLPGYDDAITENAKGADVGAILWQQVPYSFVQSRALFDDHELPLWNRYNSAGTVLLGQGQSMFGDPLHLPVIVAGGSAWAWDFKYLFARWLLCFGLGLIVLHCTRHLPAAAVTTVTAAFLGFFVYRLNHPAYFSFCYAPWILYAWIRIAGSQTWRGLAGWCGLLVLADVCELTSGTVKEAYMLLCALNFAGLVILLFARRPWRERAIALVATAWAGVLFLLLTAPVWLTFKDSLRRAYTSYDGVAAYQIHPSVALGFFDEIFYRPLVIQDQVFNPSANFLVLIGVLYFVAAYGRAGNFLHAPALAAGALLPAALTFGVIPPQWIASVPFLQSVFHIDNSFSCVLIILVVAIAGYGWAAAFTRLGTAEGRGDLGRIAGLYALLVVPWISLTHTVHRATFGRGTTFTFLEEGQRLPVSGFVWGSLIALTAAAVLLLFVVRRARVRRSLDLPGLLLLGLAFTTILWRHGVHGPWVGAPDYVFTPPVRVDFHAESPAIVALKADQSEPGRALGLGRNFSPGWSGNYGIESVSGADALINPYYRELTAALGMEQIWNWRMYILPTMVATMKPALDFLNVRHYADLRSDQSLLGRDLTPVKIGDLDVYRSETTWPRAFFCSSISTYETPQQLADLIRQAEGQPFAAVQTSDLPDLPEVAARIASTGGTPLTQKAHDYRLTTNKTSFTVDATGAGVAVLHETWAHRSFNVSLNGKPVPYFRVNHAFKGVLIPAAGTYRVEFAYWPRRMTTALVMAATGMMLVLLTSFVAWRAPFFRRSLIIAA